MYFDVIISERGFIYGKNCKKVQVSLETVLWNYRVALRGVRSTEKNRDAVIGLVFLKFAGDKFEKRRAELLEQYGNIPVFLEKASFYNAVNVFYLKETARWSYIVKNAICESVRTVFFFFLPLSITISSIFSFQRRKSINNTSLVRSRSRLLYEHTARTATRVIHNTAIRLYHLSN